jgi:hypothetical protein
MRGLLGAEVEKVRMYTRTDSLWLIKRYRWTCNFCGHGARKIRWIRHDDDCLALIDQHRRKPPHDTTNTRVDVRA